MSNLYPKQQNTNASLLSRQSGTSYFSKSQLCNNPIPGSIATVQNIVIKEVRCDSSVPLGDISAIIPTPTNGIINITYDDLLQGNWLRARFTTNEYSLSVTSPQNLRYGALILPVTDDGLAGANFWQSYREKYNINQININQLISDIHIVLRGNIALDIYSASDLTTPVPIPTEYNNFYVSQKGGSLPTSVTNALTYMIYNIYPIPIGYGPTDDDNFKLQLPQKYNTPVC
jgi:hypothetical protein